MSEVNRVWYYENGGHRRHTQRRVKDRGKLLRYYAKKRASAKELPYDLDEYKEQFEQRVMAGFCELTGLPFDYDASQGFRSPSVDRIQAGKGYVYDNIRIICFGMNVAINQWGEEVLREAVEAWLERTET